MSNDTEAFMTFPCGLYFMPSSYYHTHTYEKHTTQKNIKDPQKKYHLEPVSLNILLEGLNRFHGASLYLSSDMDKTHRCFVLHERALAYQ